jgi:hypothetical protein
MWLTPKSPLVNSLFGQSLSLAQPISQLSPDPMPSLKMLFCCFARPEEDEPIDRAALEMCLRTLAERKPQWSGKIIYVGGMDEEKNKFTFFRPESRCRLLLHITIFINIKLKKK